MIKDLLKHNGPNKARPCKSMTIGERTRPIMGVPCVLHSQNNGATARPIAKFVSHDSHHQVSRDDFDQEKLTLRSLAPTPASTPSHKVSVGYHLVQPLLLPLPAILFCVSNTMSSILDLSEIIDQSQLAPETDPSPNGHRSEFETPRLGAFSGAWRAYSEHVKIVSDRDHSREVRTFVP